jgi:hypothetical protein
MDKPSRSPWFRFSLRTMFVLVTALCCYLAWQLSIVRERQAVRQQLKDNVAIGFTTAEAWAQGTGKSNTTESKTIPLVRRWLGDEAIQEIWCYSWHANYVEAERDRLAKLFPEAEIVEPLPEPCHPGCFPHGTLVDTPLGGRSIENIRPGDAVTAIDEEGRRGEAAVESVFRTTNRLWKIESEAGILTTTETQPLCTDLDETKPAGQLMPGDKILVRCSETIQIVEVLSVTGTEKMAEVVNLVLGDQQVFIADGFLARSKPPEQEQD